MATTSSQRATLALVCLIFFALGLMTAAIGPVLPELAERTGSDLSAVGAVFTGLFLGALISQLISGPLGDRFGMRVVLRTGIGLLALGALMLTFSRSLWLTLGLALFAGLGHGAVDLGGNVWIARIFGERSVSALNLLNLFYGIGAFIGPAAAGLSFTLLGTGIPALWLSAAFLLATFVWMWLGASAEPAAQHAVATRPAMGIYRSGLLWMLGGLILVYVGVENGLGGWVTTYMQRTTQVEVGTAAMLTAGFWLALTAGRMASVALGFRISSQTLLTGSLVGASLGGALFVLGHGNAVLTTAAVLLMGFCFGPIYPTMMAVVTQLFPRNPSQAAGLIQALGSVGGMLLPWLQGLVLERVDTLSCAFFSAAGILMMLAIQVVQSRRAVSPAVKELAGTSS